jgi:hypothetical protein
LKRWQAAQHLPGDFVLPVEPLRALSAASAEPERIVRLCESVAEPQRAAARCQNSIIAELEEVAAKFNLPPHRVKTWREQSFALRLTFESRISPTLSVLQLHNIAGPV